MNKELTSIQVSVKHRDKLKEYCDQNGCNMNRVVEKLIEDNIMKANGLKTITVPSGTKQEIVEYLRKTTNNRIASFTDTDGLNEGDLCEMKKKSFEQQIDWAGGPLVRISMWKARVVDSTISLGIVAETFFVTDYFEAVAESQENTPSRKKLEQWLNSLENNPDSVDRLKRMVGTKA
jgi:hypothetical protein